MKEKFDYKLRLNNANKKMLEQINSILEGYVSEGYVLTLRQLYYQLVSRDIVPNNDKEYKKLSNILKKGRMAGIVDWSSIEDRVRKPKVPYWVRDIQDALEDTLSHFRFDRMRTQKNIVEVWVEKDALSNILERVTSKYHVRLMVNRGYSSVSAMYDAAKRLSDGDTVLYFGDHDPSGLDMIRDIKDRLDEFNVDVSVKPIALNMEQIRKFNPPPNPAKLTDTRSKWYVDTYGPLSWELDALPPEELISLTENAIKEHIDISLYDDVLFLENRDKVLLREMIDGIK